MTDSGQEKQDSIEETDLFEELTPFEPYTTDELAAAHDIERSTVRKLLEKLTGEGKVRKKSAKKSPILWIREPPKHSCQNCDRQFEINYLHPVLSAVKFCPRCGTQLRE